MGRSTHPWLSRARPGSAEPGSGSPGRIGFGPTDPIPIPGFLNLGNSYLVMGKANVEPSAEWSCHCVWGLRFLV
ncbi:hypothetical protein Taro_029226 [Colocasia esculenta]|uniref:Uncharacterized protein n=1 Tax=Colocasia esculenta TaxID=4460 RepID=A0A843VZN7_COLES|nr:hypothetical protein [Colocasia esculenta]